MHEDFGGNGEVGGDLARVDWRSTPLGEPGTWPQSLRTAVDVILSSRFSMWMAWGPELTFFCNDAYRRDTLGKKYPWALGRPAYEVWSEIWADIGPRIDTVMRTGEATWDEALLLFLERSGYVEETYHTFSYSPLRDDHGVIAGMLCVVSEETERVVAERRIATLQLLGTETTAVTDERAGLGAVCRILARNDRSLPFSLVYLFDRAGESAVLAGQAGILPGDAAAPTRLSVGDPAAAWPVDRLVEGHPVLLPDLQRRFPRLPTGGWPEPPDQALVLPLHQQGQSRPYGFLVTALNRYRPFDTGYRSFVELIAGHVSAVITSARAYDAERRRAETLAALDKAKTDFFTNVSHEFRTPLTLLLGPAEDALVDGAEPLPPTQRRRVEVINRNAQRLLKLVNTLLDFSRLESGRMQAVFEPVDLGQYTAELASMFRSAVERAGLELEVDCPSLPEPVYVDPEMWAKIVLNLLSNAVKFTFEGSITVRLRLVAGSAELSVEDTGVGVEQDELTRLFERFHRVAGARSRSQEGSGIGLALVAELTALQHGEVTATSTVGTGSRFTVRVPLGRDHLPDSQVVAADTVSRHSVVTRQARGFLAESERWAEERPERPAGVAVAADDPRPRVLVVDDNPDMRDYVVSLLEADYVVDTAADGLRALEVARAARPHLVLTDVMMPRLDGFGLLKALHADPATADIPVILLSARAGDEAPVAGLESGADDYLVKPFVARELLARVRANLELDRVRRTRDQLQRSRALLDQAQRLARVGSWTLDLAEDTLTGSAELLRMLDRGASELHAMGREELVRALVHPEDQPRMVAALERGLGGEPIDVEVRLLRRDGKELLVTVLGELERSEAGAPLALRGSVQDVTETRSAERELAEAAIARQVAAHEHAIADELQRELLPERSFALDHLEVATYYRAGVEGTQVGGDWYDVIELGAGRTALVVGDVMGRGVRAAAVMGQLRAAIRAYARLDLRPADVLEYLDGIVRDQGPDQIVTCVYAVFDPKDRTLTYANAGHLPPLLAAPGAAATRLSAVAGPPLGAGPSVLQEESLALDVGSVVGLYTDGLVERRGRDIDAGVEVLAAQVGAVGGPLGAWPERLVEVLLPEGPDDDVALLLARVRLPAESASVSARFADREDAAARARSVVGTALTRWRLPESTTHDVVLMTSELVTNALVHGELPIELRLRRSDAEIILEVEDEALVGPRKMRPTTEDEGGRGVQIIALLADRWGTRPTATGKVVWAVVSLPAPVPAVAAAPD